MTRRKRKKRWSYNAGHRGRNWVRAFEKPDGSLHLEWMEDGRRKRLFLRHVSTKDNAKRKADELAVEFIKLEGESRVPITITQLLHEYVKEVTPTKSTSKQGHDRRALRLWRSFFDSQPELGRRSERKAGSLDRIDWDRFISQRTSGEIPGWPKRVKNQQVSYDLKFMIAVLNWATGQGIHGRSFLATSPWRAEVRRSQKWTMPRELNPHRPGMTSEIREALIARAPSWQFGLALLLQRETRRRNSSIRQLMWSDIDLEAEEVTWRGKLDKSGKENATPLTHRAVEALRNAPSRGIGMTPVFPAATNPRQPTPRNTFQIFLVTIGPWSNSSNHDAPYPSVVWPPSDE